MHILIFGSGGALAGQLEEIFREQEVVALGHADCDITNADTVSSVIEKYRPSHILNAAAYNAVDEAETDDTVAVAVNATAVGHIAAAAEKYGAVFVSYSTDYVFDGTKQEGYRESDATNPINAYGRSKLAGERAIEAVAAEHSSFPYFIIRTSRLFGPQGIGNRAKKSFVDLMLERTKASEPVEVLDAEVSSPTLTGDLAHATRKLFADAAPAGIYHITNSGTCTRYSFAQEIFKQWRELTGQPQPALLPVSVFQGQSAPRPVFSVLLNTKMQPLRSWQEALADYLKKKARP